MYFTKIALPYLHHAEKMLLCLHCSYDIVVQCIVNKKEASLKEFFSVSQITKFELQFFSGTDEVFAYLIKLLVSMHQQLLLGHVNPIKSVQCSSLKQY